MSQLGQTRKSRTTFVMPLSPRKRKSRDAGGTSVSCHKATLAVPETVGHRLLATLWDKLVRIGAKAVVSDQRAAFADAVPAAAPVDH